MPERSISQHFEYLDTPLTNNRWSWGAAAGGEPPSGGEPPKYVILRIWQDRCEKRDWKLWARITHHDKYKDFESLGWKERLTHVEWIKSGVQAFCIMCRVEDPQVSPRVIASFNEKSIFVGGELIEFDGDYWLELTEKWPVAKFKDYLST